TNDHDPILWKPPGQTGKQKIATRPLSPLPTSRKPVPTFPTSIRPFVLDSHFQPEHCPICGMFPLQTGLHQGGIQSPDEKGRGCPIIGKGPGCPGPPLKRSSVKYRTEGPGRCCAARLRHP